MAPMAKHRGGRVPWLSVCVHAARPQGFYGTVCASVIALGPRGDGFFHAAGPPCAARLEDQSALLAALGGAGADASTRSSSR